LKNLEKIELSKNPKKLNLEGPVNQAITTKNSFYEITASDQLQRASHFSHGFQQKNRVAAPIWNHIQETVHTLGKIVVQ